MPSELWKKPVRIGSEYQVGHGVPFAGLSE
jgi:hypothetical protein